MLFVAGGQPEIPRKLPVSPFSLPIGPIVVLFGGSYVESYKEIPKKELPWGPSGTTVSTNTTASDVHLRGCAYWQCPVKTVQP